VRERFYFIMRHSAFQLWSLLAVYFGCFFAFAVLAQSWPQSESFFPQFWTAWCGAIIGIWLVFWFSREVDKPRNLALLIGGGLCADVLCNRLAIQASPDSSALSSPLQWLFLACGNLGVVAAAIGIGVIVARGLQKPNYLIMAAIVGALTDIFSVFSGPSKVTLHSEVFPYVSYQWGVVGHGTIIPIVGAGDFLFLALYFSGVRRFHLSENKTLIAMCVDFALGFLSLLVRPEGIPALPFMATLLLIVHGRELRNQMRAGQSLQEQTT
jgi:hypothetical protein